MTSSCHLQAGNNGLLEHFQGKMQLTMAWRTQYLAAKDRAEASESVLLNTVTFRQCIPAESGVSQRAYTVVKSPVHDAQQPADPFSRPQWHSIQSQTAHMTSTEQSAWYEHTQAGVKSAKPLLPLA